MVQRPAIAFLVMIGSLSAARADTRSQPPPSRFSVRAAIRQQRPPATQRPATQQPGHLGASLAAPARSSSLGEPKTTGLAGGPLRSGTYRITQDNSHAHLSGQLQARANDTVFTVKDGAFTFGDHGVLTGMRVQLKPETRTIQGKLETIGWSGKAERYNPNNQTTDIVTVRISGSSYRTMHPGLREVSVDHEMRSGFRTLASNHWSSAAWRASSDTATR